MENSEQDSLENLAAMLISITDAAEVSGMTRSWIRRLVQRGEIEGVKIGQNWFTTEKAVREYLKQDRRPGPKKD